MIDLAINKTYLADKWGSRQAIREIVQNCIDEGLYTIKKIDDNTYSFITPGTELTIDKLALGTTSKANDKSKVGKYGEGLKVGFAALLRDGCGIKIKTGSGQIWTPVFQWSTLFLCTTLQIDVKDDTEQQSGVEILLTNVHEDLHDIAIPLDLAIDGSEPTDIVDTEFGSIIKDKAYAGKIYVEGIYIQNVASFANIKFGFNFKSEYVDLDRDRQMVDFWDLMKLVAKALVKSEQIDDIADFHKNAMYASNYIEDELCTSKIEVKTAFTNRYLSASKKESIVDNVHKDDMRFSNTIAINDNDVIKKYLDSTKKKCSYYVIAEDSSKLRDIINADAKKQEALTALNAEATLWNETYNKKLEELKNFNCSFYKLFIAIANSLSKTEHVPELTLALLNIGKSKADVSKFSNVIHCIDESKVTADDYKAEDLIAEVISEGEANE